MGTLSCCLCGNSLVPLRFFDHYLAPDHRWASDIWSLGCILYELTNLTNPFREKGLDLKALFQKVCRAEIPSMTGPGTTEDRYSDHLRSLITRMLQKNPEKRPSITEVVDFSRNMLSALARRRVARASSSQSASDAASSSRSKAQSPKRASGEE